MQAMCKNLHYPTCHNETVAVIGAADSGAEGLWIDFKFPDLIQKPPERYYWKAENCDDSFLLTGKSSARKGINILWDNYLDGFIVDCRENRRRFSLSWPRG
jgi:hypothetical protein